MPANPRSAGPSATLTPRAKLAVTAGKVAAAVSRTAGRGSGSVIGGKVALRFEPDLLRALAEHLDVVLVSATNGKTTTTRLIAEALKAAGPVVSNALGANMPAGITSALAEGAEARFGVIEVDEKYLAGVARDTAPKAIALLNLSRDQLDRSSETRMLAEKWREGLAGSQAVVIAHAHRPRGPGAAPPRRRGGSGVAGSRSEWAAAAGSLQQVIDGGLG